MKTYKFKYFVLAAFAFLLISLVGCWDYMEVEERGYVLGMAIDKYPPLPRGQEELEEYLSERDLEKMPLQQGRPKYAYTIQIPVIPEAIAAPEAAGGGGEAGALERTWDLTIAGNSLFEVNRQFSTRTSYAPFYEHLKVIVISEEVAREGIKEILDMAFRDHEMRRRTRVFITPAEAKKVLDMAPRIDDYASLYLEKLPLNATKTSRIPHKTDLGEVSKSVHGELDFVLPRVIATKDEAKYAGAAIFKGDKMVGWLGELDTNYAKWARDAVIGGIEIVESPHPSAELVVLEIIRAKTNVRPVVENNNIKMHMDITATFNLSEEFRSQFQNAFDREFIREVETRVEEKLKREIKDTITYVQSEYGADIFHFNVVMQRYEPKVWDEIQGNWRDIFPQVEVEVEVDAKIRSIGLMK